MNRKRIAIEIRDKAQGANIITFSGQPLPGVKSITIDMQAHKMSTVTVVFYARDVAIYQERHGDNDPLEPVMPPNTTQ